MKEKKKARLLKDFVRSSLSGCQNYGAEEITFEELLDWLEIDATHILKRIERFRENGT